MATLWLDLRYALRLLAKTPGLTVVLALTLALGIGASTTIFSVVNSVVLRPLPYDQPERLVRIYTEFRGPQDMRKFWISPPELDDLRRSCRTCASVAAWAPLTISLAGSDRPIRLDALAATHTLLPTLNVRPLLGRWFTEDEDRPGETRVIVLGHAAWKRAFAGDPSIIGRSVLMNAVPVTVIGVMPAGFSFLEREEAWIPLNYDWANARRGNHFLSAVIRLRPDASVAALRAEIHALTTSWASGRGPADHVISHDDPSRPSHPLRAEPFQADLVGGLSTTLWMLQAAVLLVLLISIVNVANLLLARAETRTREVAVRHALGASRRRLVRQFITESLLLGMIGGALGVLVAVWAVDGVVSLIPTSAPRAGEIALDARAVMFAVGCALAAALLFGMAPILHARRTDLHGALKDGSPRTTGSRARLRVRRGLVVAELALAVILVVGCTVMVRSFLRLQQVEIGLRADHLLTFQLELPPRTYPLQTGVAMWTRIEQRMRALPGVVNATLADGLPPSRPIDANDFTFPGRTPPTLDEKPWNVDYWQVVGDDFAATLGIRVTRGRDLARSDVAESPGVVLVNEAFAAKFFPDRDPIGQQLQLTPTATQTIVGVVSDSKQAGLDREPGTEIYMLARQYTRWFDDAPQSLWVVLRTAGPPAALSAAVTRALAELDPTLPISHLRTMDDVLWEAVARPRFLTFLLSAFAGLALLLAAVGIYGVMSHTVAQRTHEIGLRMALGAHPAQVRAMVLRQASTLVATGVGLGLVLVIALDLALGSSLRALLYGGALAQPVLLVAVAALIIATALLATWFPARRATQVQPTLALRSE